MVGDLFDEVMNVLGDVDGTASDHHRWQKNVDHELAVPVSCTNSGAGFHCGLGQPPELCLLQKRPLMGDFGRQVMNEPNPGVGDDWGPNPSTLISALLHPSLTVPSDTSQFHAVNQKIRQNTDIQPQMRQQAPRPVRKLDLSQFEYNPCTPKRSNPPISSSPSTSSPIPYNLRRPYKPPIGRQKVGESDHTSSQIRGTQRNSQKGAAGSEGIAFSHAPTVDRGIPLIPVNLIPDRFREIFPFPLFNAIQSRCFHSVYRTNDNIVLSSPTGSGKTVVLELAICALANELTQGNYKVVYQAPTKALCAERKRDWEKKFTAIGLVCTELTGDTQQAQLKNVKNGDIIITTPEKWDSMTRRWGDHKKLLELVRLFLIDEIHILKEARGATLEVVVSRMKSIGSNVRFVALSATVPNSADIAIWLGKDSENPKLPASEQRFGEEFRPVKLQKIVYGYPYTGNDFMFNKALDKMLPDVIQKHSSGKPMMIFCMTRAMCVNTAKILAGRWKTLQQRERYWPAPTIEFSFKDRDLQSTGTCGVAFHHAGLDASDRVLVERLFLEGCLHVICCTSTLAVGVNLPVYLVIIKNTVTWSDGQTKDYVDLEVMQMIGRAGRPQFDGSAVAVIMTKKENKARYEKMVSGTEVLESCLHGNLVEHMNAEIGLGTITNAESAKDWLRSTFLYVRLKRNPAHYKLGQGGGSKDVDRRLEKICEESIDLLAQAGLVLDNGSGLECSELGSAMARYYIKFMTMKTILGLGEKAKVPGVLLALSQAEEFKDIRFRSGEKGLYKELNKSIKYPSKAELINASHKAYILIQFEVGMMEFPVEANFQKHKTTLMQDKNLVFQHCHRVIRCIIDCRLHFKDSISVKSSLEVARCLKAGVWENSPLQLRQIEGFGPASVKKLVNAGVRSLEMLEQLEPHKIESIMSRNPPFGSKVAKAVRDIPKLRVLSQQISKVGNRKDPVKLKVRAEIGYLNDKVPGRFRGMVFVNFLAERSDGLLVDFRRIPIFKLEGGKDVQFIVDLETPNQTVICHLVCEDIVGTLKTHELKPSIEFVLYPPRASLSLPLPMITQEKVIQSLIIAREAEERPFLVNSEIKNGATLPPNAEQPTIPGSEGLTVNAGKDLYFLHIDDFDDDIIQQTKENTNTNTTHPKSAINPVLIDLREEQDGGIGQLPNGNFMCRHKCGDKARCKHFCCREGLEKTPKPLKRKTNMTGDKKAVEDDVLTLGLELKPRQKRPTKSFISQRKPKHASALVTYIRNTEIEVLDLIGDEGNAYQERNAASNLERLKTLYSKSSTTNIKPLVKKPIYSYSMKELPELSFVEFGRARSSDNKEPPPPINSPTHNLGGGALAPYATTDYDEIGIDSLMADIVINESVIEKTQTDNTFNPTSDSSMASSSTHPEIGLRLAEHQNEKSFLSGDRSHFANESIVGEQQAAEFPSLKQNYNSSSSATKYEETTPGDNTHILQASLAFHQMALPHEGHDNRALLLRGLTRRLSEAMGSTLPGKPVVGKKRKDPFTTHIRAQRKRSLVNLGSKSAGDGALSGPSNTNINDGSKAKNRVREPNNITPHALASSREVPVNILDFLGECVIYSGIGTTTEPYEVPIAGRRRISDEDIGGS